MPWCSGTYRSDGHCCSTCGDDPPTWSGCGAYQGVWCSRCWRYWWASCPLLWWDADDDDDALELTDDAPCDGTWCEKPVTELAGWTVECPSCFQHYCFLCWLCGGLDGGGRPPAEVPQLKWQGACGTCNRIWEIEEAWEQIAKQRNLSKREQVGWATGLMPPPAY